MRWVETNGGPFIWLPSEHRSVWEGTEPPSDGRVVRARFRWDGQKRATDYDAACDSANPIGRVCLRGVDAIAIERGSKTWLARRRTLIHWEHAPNERHVAKLLRDDDGPDPWPRARWKRLRTRISIETPRLVLFDAAYPGRRPPWHLVTIMNPGSYAIEHAEWHPDEETLLVLYRLALV